MLHAVRNFQATTRDHTPVAIEAGPIDEDLLPADTLKNCLRLGWVVSGEPKEAPAPPKPEPQPEVKPEPAADPEPEATDVGAPALPTDWLAASVDELDLEPRVIALLQSAKLRTVGEVLKFGNEHNGITEVKGIGTATEKEVREAIQKLKAERA